MVLEKSLESPLDCKEIQTVHPKWDQSWLLFGRTDVEGETPILWPPDAKSWFTGKEPDAGKGWGQEEKGTTEDEMVGWHYWLNGLESEQSPRVGGGQGSLACCSSWGRKESDTTELLNWTELNWKMTIGSELTFFQRRLTNGQYVQYQIFNITNLQGNANQNHNEIPFRMAVIKMTEDNKGWQDCGRKRTFLYHW